MAVPPLNRILLVDDEPDIREVVSLALEAVGGFTVEVGGSAVEALQKAVEFAPELILLDVMMPGTDGPGVLRMLRELPATLEIPVIFMTAKVQPQEIVRFKNLGAVDVIAKPIDPMTLSATVNAIWSRCHD